MHVRWRGLELPAKVTADPQSLSDTFGRFAAEPFERGFGTTVGNSLRRILLSSLEGAAVTRIRIEGVTHEFSTIPGVHEDVVDIVLNIKGLVVDSESDEPKVVRIRAQGPGDVTAAQIESDASVRVLNPERHICKLTDNVKFEMDLVIERGRGYRPASEAYSNGQEQVIGEIPVDAIFSPVQRVRYRVEDTRVGQRTNYDKLLMDIWTNGTISPEMALVEAAKILRKHLNPFVSYDSAGSVTALSGISPEQDADVDLERKLGMGVEDLELSVRASNCLESAQIRTVAQLVQKTEDELLNLRAFGKTSLREVVRKLDELGLALGMRLPEGFAQSSGA
jgi:DNA-directed RNA polymerase subunit alpha